MKIPYKSWAPRRIGFHPRPGYYPVMAQCKKCLKTWFDVGIKYDEEFDVFSFDFDSTSGIIGEVEFDDVTETVTCKKCGGKLRFLRWERKAKW